MAYVSQHDPISAEPHPRFVVQKHWARQLHYDFRLEIADRLVSWAIPKGPSLDPGVRRLAVRTADHPLSYSVFEGVIPAGQYGAGVVMVWDTGAYEPLLPAHVKPETWLDRGYLRFILHGQKLHGLWEMLRYQRSTAHQEPWLLVKLRDRFTHPGYDPESQPASALSGRSHEEIARAGETPTVAAELPAMSAGAVACTDPIPELEL